MTTHRAPLVWLASAGIACLVAANENDTSSARNGTSSNGTIPQVVLPQWDEVISQDKDVNASEKLDLLTATWVEPFRVKRCPVQQTANVTLVEGGKIDMRFSYGDSKLYSIVESSLSAGDLSKYDGIEMRFATEGLTDFKLRLQDNSTEVRFIAAIKVERDGMHNLWLKWSDFHGEKMRMAGIDPCSAKEACGQVSTSAVSALGLLVPIPAKNVTWSSSFTIHALTADVLARETSTKAGADTTGGGGGGSGGGVTSPAPPPSAKIRPSSEAESVRFQDEAPQSISSVHVRQHGQLCSLLTALFIFLPSMGQLFT